LVAIPATPVLEDLPDAVLGAVVIVAVAKLVRLGAIVRLLPGSRAQAFVAIGTLVATIAAAPRVELGVAIGIGLSILAHLYRELPLTATAVVDGERLVIAPKGAIWFATVPALDERLRRNVADHPEVASVDVDLGSVGRLDYSGASLLARWAEESTANGVPVRFVNIPPSCERGVRNHLRNLTHDGQVL